MKEKKRETTQGAHQRGHSSDYSAPHTHKNKQYTPRIRREMEPCVRADKGRREGFLLGRQDALSRILCAETDASHRMMGEENENGRIGREE